MNGLDVVALQGTCGGLYWQGAQPSGETSTPPLWSDKIVRKMNDGPFGALPHDRRVIANGCESFARLK